MRHKRPRSINGQESKPDEITWAETIIQALVANGGVASTKQIIDYSKRTKNSYLVDAEINHLIRSTLSYLNRGGKIVNISRGTWKIMDDNADG